MKRTEGRRAGGKKGSGGVRGICTYSRTFLHLTWYTQCRTITTTWKITSSTTRRYAPLFFPSSFVHVKSLIFVFPKPLPRHSLLTTPPPFGLKSARSFTGRLLGRRRVRREGGREGGRVECVSCRLFLGASHLLCYLIRTCLSTANQCPSNPPLSPLLWRPPPPRLSLSLVQFQQVRGPYPRALLPRRRNQHRL